MRGRWRARIRAARLGLGVGRGHRGFSGTGGRCGGARDDLRRGQRRRRASLAGGSRRRPGPTAGPCSRCPWCSASCCSMHGVWVVAVTRARDPARDQQLAVASFRLGLRRSSAIRPRSFSSAADEERKSDDRQTESRAPRMSHRRPGHDEQILEWQELHAPVADCKVFRSSALSRPPADGSGRVLSNSSSWAQIVPVTRNGSRAGGSTGTASRRRDPAGPSNLARIRCAPLRECLEETGYRL
jgi:hypothetical protein